MNVMITGAKGQLGKEVARQMKEVNSYTLFLCDVDELDITEIESVKSYCTPLNLDIIINCAAYTAVDRCEEEVDLAYKVNAIGPRNLAIVAESIGAKLVHISTDYVFDGEGIQKRNIEDAESAEFKTDLRPYTEFDVTGPETVYGDSKLAGENFVKEFCTRYFILRTAWLYGDGNNFVRTIIGLSEKYPELKVVDDQIGSPTSTYELTKGILSLIETENYGLYHGTCEGRCSWYEFTQEIFRIKGINTNVKACTSEEYPRPAKRPHWSVLDNMMFRLNGVHTFAHWKDAVHTYLT